jgi:hypothetical protein
LVINATGLFVEPAELILEFLHPAIRSEIDVGLFGVHVENKGGGGAHAADLQGLLVERLGQIGEDEFGDTAGQAYCCGAGHHGSIGVNGDRTDLRIDGCGGEHKGRNQKRT